MGMFLIMVLALFVLRALSGTGHRHGSTCGPALWPGRAPPGRRRTTAGRPPAETPEQMLQRLYVDGLLTDEEYEEKLYALFSKA